MRSRRLRVLIAEDHAMVREGIASLVHSQPDMEIVGQACDGHEALDLAERTQPDVVLLDLSMPRIGGPEAMQRLHALRPAPKVLVLTRHGDQGHLQLMMRAGASGYLLKRAASSVLIESIRSVANGTTVVDPTLVAAYVARSGLGRGGTAALPRAHLSEREEQVLRLIAWGKSNKEVAAALCISMKTAESYKASALEKLGLRTRTDIMRFALAERWLELDEAPD
jgi:DNA-binding NarL/FixJ family response regulator